MNLRIFEFFEKKDRTESYALEEKAQSGKRHTTHVGWMPREVSCVPRHFSFAVPYMSCGVSHRCKCHLARFPRPVTTTTSEHPSQNRTREFAPKPVSPDLGRVDFASIHSLLRSAGHIHSMCRKIISVMGKKRYWVDCEDKRGLSSLPLGRDLICV